MAQVVLGIGSSHGPSIQTMPDMWERLGVKDTRDPRFDYQELLQSARPGLEREITLDVQRARHTAAHAALGKLVDIITQAKLDLVVVISNIHRVRRDHAHPVFGVLRADSFEIEKRAIDAADLDAKFTGAKRRAPEQTVPMPGGPSLANHLIESLIEDGFDVASVDRLPEGLPLDDAYTFIYDHLLGGAVMPMVPFFLSRDLPNQATPGRCYDLGTALRRTIESWPQNLRVGLIASGGLSHQIVDEELDRTVIDALVAGDAKAMRGLSRAQLNRSPGTPEILNWVTVAAAMAPLQMKLIDYLPCYRSLAGTGHGVTFGYWK